MKRLLMLCGLVTAVLCASQNAQAQYVSQIHRDGDSFVDDRGVSLSDQELVSLIGEDIYHETVIGARKQFNAGNRLIRSGAICAGIGLTGIIAGTVVIATSESGWQYDGYYDPDYYEDEQVAAGVILLAAGCVVGITGSLLLDAGIPLRIIGQSRLNWVENDFNERNRDVTLHFGAAPSGIGLTVAF